MFTQMKDFLIYFLCSISNVSKGEASVKVEQFLKTTTYESLVNHIESNDFSNYNFQDFIDFLKGNTTEIEK